MFTRRSLRRSTTALFVVVSMIFAQLALAAYACPAAAGLTPVAMSEPCDGMDTEQPALCHERTAAAPQTLDVQKTPSPSLPAIILVLTAPQPALPIIAVSLRRLGSVEARPPPDPLFLSTLRLRV